MIFCGNGLGSNAEGGLEDSFMQQDDIQFALQWRNIGEKLGQIDALPKRENVERACLRISSWIDADGALRAGASEASKEFLARFGLLGVTRKRELFGSKPRFQMSARIGPGEIVNVGGDAVRWQNGEAFGMSVDERHHDAFEGCLWIEFSCTHAAFVAVRQRGFIAMMAIGNHEFLIRHRFLNFSYA